MTSYLYFSPFTEESILGLLGHWEFSRKGLVNRHFSPNKIGDWMRDKSYFQGPVFGSDEIACEDVWFTSNLRSSRGSPLSR